MFCRSFAVVLVQLHPSLELAPRKVNAEAVEDLTHWKGYLEGPAGTPYEGGHFVIDISIPEESARSGLSSGGCFTAFQLVRVGFW